MVPITVAHLGPQCYLMMATSAFQTEGSGLPLSPAPLRAAFHHKGEGSTEPQKQVGTVPRGKQARPGQQLPFMMDLASASVLLMSFSPLGGVCSR